MTSRVFVDTNVLVYAEDNAEREKQKRASAILTELIPSGRMVISTQVLQELFNAATRKLRLPAVYVRGLVEDYSQLDVVLVRSELILGAIDLHRLCAISFWDALVIRAASEGGCTRLLSENLQHGQTIEGVRIENPFLATRSAEPRARYKTRGTSRRSIRSSARAGPR